MLPQVLTILFILILTIIALRFPPLPFAIFLLTSGQGDGYGVSGYILTTQFSSYTYLILVPGILATFVSCVKIWMLYREGVISHRFLILAAVAVFITIWAALGAYSKGFGAIQILREALNTRTYSIVFALAYWKSPKARMLFIGILIIQLVTAASLLIFPNSFLSVISARNYLPSWAISDQIWQEMYTGGLARITMTYRATAQFHNPNVYGYYTLFGLLVGGFLFFGKKQFITRLAGIVLVITGGFGWAVTISRGATLGLVLSVIIIWVRAMILSKKQLNIYRLLTKSVLVMFFSLLVTIIFSLPLKDIINVVLAGFGDTNFNYRVNALEAAPSFLKQYPLFGVTPQAKQLSTYLSPHQTIPYYAVNYGIPVGICITLITYWSIAGIYKTFSKKITYGQFNIGLWEEYLFVCFALYIFFAGFSNATAADSINWICFGLACIPWASSYKQKEVPKKFGNTTILSSQKRQITDSIY